MIGLHIPKKGGFIKTLKGFYEEHEENKTKPIQIFSGSPKFWKRPNVTLEEQSIVKEYINKYSLQVFVHSLYLINLSWEVDNFSEKAQGCLEWELKNGAAMGFKGVVVHCGKSCKMPISKALDNMYDNLYNILSVVDPTCPLLLETSTGQGTELCYLYDDFKNFYNRFDASRREKLKICIDTCHVFAGGNEPFNFIKNWYEEFPNTLVLVHYNDSKGPCGCRKDRHEIPGSGEIGGEKMKLIADWCKEHNIPMVIE